MAGRIHWSLREQVNFKQHAWSDTCASRVPYSGTFDPDAIAKALRERFPRESSYGRLHWRTGVSFTPISTRLDRKGGELLIEESWGIAD